MPDSGDRRRPTIRDVAAQAGVSKSLVSLVLRDSPKVSEGSRAAVLTAIDELGYRPSATARSLVSGRSGLIGIITSNALDFFYFEVIEGVSAHLHGADTNLTPLISHGTRDLAAEATAADRFLELRVESIMLMGSSMPNAAIEQLATEVPVVLVGRYLECPGVDAITTDDTRGGYLAGRHLTDLGHRRVAHITGGDGNGAAERERGFRTAVEEAGGEAIVVDGNYNMDGGRRGAQQLIDLPGGPPTAVFAANDLCAIGAMDQLRRSGHRIPEDISIIGYDDIELAQLAGIDLTTINQPTRQMGATAAARIIKRIESADEVGQQILIEPALRVRSTTRPL
ncbi:MAG: LacI family DNA-binding transcriptional regulator [Acidimicrobiia bacterium]|nr:LacI family DNA-binding transcriptional regulator [Acidimicrobiia bacterium]NNL71601.1 LacI family DNA-binding transcriptional regulator [Acidimicrobiia bacterium]